MLKNEQLFVAVSMNSDKNVSFIADFQQAFVK